MATFILIHGAFHGGWCWERSVPLLAAGGHEVLAPNLPGMGGDTTPFAEDTLTQWVQFTADLVIRAKGLVILGGHSQGGAIISQVAELVPDKVHCLAYITALLLEDGSKLLGGIPLEEMESGTHPMLSLSEDGQLMSVNPEVAGSAFLHLSPPEDALAAARRLTPQPLRLMNTPLRLTSGRFGSVRRAYLEVTDDRAFLLDFQRHMQRNWPCDPVITLPGDHSVFYSAPEALAEALLSLVPQP